MLNWVVNWVLLMSLWQKIIDILAWERNLQVDLSVEHVMLDLTLKWNNFWCFESSFY